MEFSSSNIKKFHIFLYFRKWKPRKNFLYFLKRKLLYFRKWKLKSSLYFRRELPNTKNEKNPLLQAWKFGRNDRFVTASFPSIIKDSNNKSFQ